MTTASELFKSHRSVLVAPAGCGKTELICRAISVGNSRRELVLTHTHAGVDALRRRTKKLGLRPGSIEVQTIAGFALKLAGSYPALSGWKETQPTGKAWEGVYLAAATVLRTRAGKKIVSASFSGSFVDEYQDCGVDQHDLVLSLAEILPCRILGDPLQSVFGFKNAPVVPWTTVLTDFSPLPDLSTPHRWTGKNEQLGQWLLDVRPALLNGQPVDLLNAPLLRVRPEPATLIVSAKKLASLPGSSVVLRKWEKDAHGFSKSLSGLFGSMETIDCTDLLNLCKKLDKCDRISAMKALVEFAPEVMTNTGTLLADVKTKLDASKPVVPIGKAQRAIARLLQMADDDFSAGRDFLEAMAMIEGVSVYRRELFSELRKVLSDRQSNELFEDVGWAARDRSRRYGRRQEPNVVSRPLLVKGLEYEHAMICKPSEFNANELYVSITRASTTLTIAVPAGTTTMSYSA